MCIWSFAYHHIQGNNKTQTEPDNQGTGEFIHMKININKYDTPLNTKNTHTKKIKKGKTHKNIIKSFHFFFSIEQNQERDRERVVKQ